MNLRNLDLFLNLPGGKSLYSGEVTMSGMSYVPPTPIDRDGTKAAVIAMMDRIPTLETLTVYLARTGSADRGDPYRMFSKAQVKRGATGENYQVSGGQSWSWKEQFGEDL
jgi:hypothetical protein